MGDSQIPEIYTQETVDLADASNLQVLPLILSLFFPHHSSSGC